PPWPGRSPAASVFGFRCGISLRHHGVLTTVADAKLVPQREQNLRDDTFASPHWPHTRSPGRNFRDGFVLACTTGGLPFSACGSIDAGSVAGAATASGAATAATSSAGSAAGATGTGGSVGALGGGGGGGGSVGGGGVTGATRTPGFSDVGGP